MQIVHYTLKPQSSREQKEGQRKIYVVQEFKWYGDKVPTPFHNAVLNSSKAQRDQISLDSEGKDCRVL